MLPAPFDQLRTQVIGLDNFAGRARVTKAALNQRTQLESQVQRWTEAGLIDAQVGTRILAFEAGQERRASLRWPVLFAMVFGGILVFAGITLFVAAHWNELSPGVRFSLVLLMVGAFHVGGAALTDRFPPLSTTLHALGTATLGAAIFLTAQIFNLHEDWAAGVLLWAIGAAVGYILLQDWTQAAAVALLTPAWLISQWIVIAGNHTSSSRPLAFGLILTALCYLSVRIGDQQGTARRTLVWIGGIALLPCVVAAFVLAVTDMELGNTQSPPLGLVTLLVVWTIASAGPLVLAWLLRGGGVWMNVVGAGWAYVVVLSAAHMSSRVPPYHRNPGASLAFYALCALGSVALVAWGLHEKRKERLNLGILGFAVSVLFFYFDSFMGKLGRSASLLILGVLCLAGGYVLEITRRKLMARMEISQ